MKLVKLSLEHFKVTFKINQQCSRIILRIYMFIISVGRRYHIHLGKNKLNRLEAGAFQSVLEQIMAETAEDNSNSSETRIGIYDSKIL